MPELSYHGIKADRVAICPSCGAEAIQRLNFHHCPKRKGEQRDREYETYWVTVCQACNGLNLWGSQRFSGLVCYHSDSIVPLYPAEHVDQQMVPTRIAGVYEEAKRIKMLSPNGFSVLIRRALESVCDDKGIKDATLVKRLGALVSQEQFPKSVEGVTKAIRLLGNVGAHSGSLDVTQDQAAVLDDLFRFVVEFVYIVPGKLASFEASLQASGIVKEKT